MILIDHNINHGETQADCIVLLQHYTPAESHAMGIPMGNEITCFWLP